jgi:hypothetical protein
LFYFNSDFPKKSKKKKTKDIEHREKLHQEQSLPGRATVSYGGTELHNEEEKSTKKYTSDLQMAIEIGHSEQLAIFSRCETCGVLLTLRDAQNTGPLVRTERLSRRG